MKLLVDTETGEWRDVTAEVASVVDAAGALDKAIEQKLELWAGENPERLTGDEDDDRERALESLTQTYDRAHIEEEGFLAAQEFAERIASTPYGNRWWVMRHVDDNGVTLRICRSEDDARREVLAIVEDCWEYEVDIVPKPDAPDERIEMYFDNAHDDSYEIREATIG